MSCLPMYHFRPERNWMNDPNGPIMVNGEIHLFYQHNPDADRWGNIHWGHAKSKDLVHWEHLQPALFPSPERGEEHCFSGCTVIADDGTPVIYYTSIGPERNAKSAAEQWIAYGDSRLLEWKKPDLNPVWTPQINGDLNILDCRDPYVWKMDGSWFMVLGGAIGSQGCVTLYRSSDMVQWDFVHVLATSDLRICECPDLFQLDDKWVLIYSPLDEDSRVRYRVGTLTADYRFVEEYEGILDYGGREGFYAANSFSDDTGRRILLSWMPDSARDNSTRIQGWSGVLALPRLMALDPENKRLKIRPVPELMLLRTKEWEFPLYDITNGGESGIRGKTLELHIEFPAEHPRSGRFGLQLFRSPDGVEETLVEIDFDRKKLVLDRTKSSLDAGTNHHLLEADLSGRAAELHVFIDHSTIEVFVDQEVCLSARVYPTREDSDGVGVYYKGGDSIGPLSLRAWPLESVY